MNNHLEVLKSLKSTSPCELVSETLVDFQGLGLDYEPCDLPSIHGIVVVVPIRADGQQIRQNGLRVGIGLSRTSDIVMENCPLRILDAPIENGVCPYIAIFIYVHLCSFSGW